MKIIYDPQYDLGGYLSVRLGDRKQMVTHLDVQNNLTTALTIASIIARENSKRLGDIEIIIHQNRIDSLIDENAPDPKFIRGCYFKRAPQDPSAFALLAKDGSIIAITSHYPLKGAMDKGHKLQKQHHHRPGGPDGPDRKSAPGGPNPKSAPTSKSTK